MTPKDIADYRTSPKQAERAFLARLASDRGLHQKVLKRALRQWPDRCLYLLLTRGRCVVPGFGTFRLVLTKPAYRRAFDGLRVLTLSRLHVRFRLGKVARNLLRDVDQSGYLDLAILKR